MSSLASAVVGLQAARTTAQIQIAVAAKLLAAQRQRGSAVVELLQSAQAQTQQSSAAVLEAAAGLDIYA